MRFLLSLAAVALAMPAHGAIITRGGLALPGAGLTTAEAGTTVEAFGSARCGPQLLTVTGDFSVTNSSVPGIRAAPAGDATCYLAVPNDSQTTQTALVTFPVGSGPIEYLGLYWGSMDNYNALTFLDAGGFPIALGAFGFSLTGDEVRAAASRPGDQVDPGANEYINIFFAPGETFTSLRIVSTGRAFEIDNIAWRTGDGVVPSPAGLALFGLGLGLLAARRLRRG
jgi:hypothetical protein